MLYEYHPRPRCSSSWSHWRAISLSCRWVQCGRACVVARQSWRCLMAVCRIAAWVVFIYACVPLFHVKRWVGHHKVGAQVGMLVVGVGAGRLFAKVKINATNYHVHGGQLPSGVVGFLAINRNIAYFALVLGDEFFGLHKETVTVYGRVIDAAFKRFEHLYD